MPVAGTATFVGSQACAGCHPSEWELWQGSHHDLAMQDADEASVLGDFDDARFSHYGVESRFRRLGERFVVTTVGAAGETADYDVAYTFGAAPLQQYLVRFPDGRLQPLAMAWDTRPVAEGGQRWFHLYPDEAIEHDDVLHWTSRAQNWNVMCAECHSTALEKGYDAQADTYETTWSEIDVACEACHGPASRHVEWAEAGGGEGERGLTVSLGSGDGEWRFAPGAAIAARSVARESNAEIETCAPCHARRSALIGAAPSGRPFLDTHRPSLLDETLYFADGQIQDEVYVWGSFLQSRMHAAGVSCSDCHEPHSLAVADPPDATCAGCHRPEVFAARSHHQHDEGTDGASCVACHMPVRTYMGVDARHDHSFRVPRPDLTERIGTPNTCNGCHTNRDAAWAARAVREWWGETRSAQPHYGEVLSAGRARSADAGDGLVALAAAAEQPGIVRATALRLLQGFPPQVAAPALDRALRDPDGLLRMAAAEAAQVQPPEQRASLLAGALQDPLRAVRVEAARVLVDVPNEEWPAELRKSYERALAEYRAVQRAASDTPAARVNLGVLHARRGALGQARAEYDAALKLAPWFIPAYVNLADIERLRGDDAAAEGTLRRALEHSPDDPDVHHALGLVLVRQGRTDQALSSLEHAARVGPGNPHYAYVYAIGLHSVGRTEDALRTLRDARNLHRGEPELLLGLAMLSRDAGALDMAREYARELERLVPGDPTARQLLAELEARRAGDQ